MEDIFSPFSSALANFFVHCNYPDTYEKPVALKHCDDFNVAQSIEKWLQWEDGSIIISAKNIKHADPSGLVLIKRSSAEITYSVHLKNVCYKRLVLAKELCHLVIQSLDYDNIIDVSQFLVSVTRHDGVGGFYDHNTSQGRREAAAQLMAEHLLVPWFENEKILKSSQSNYELAVEYRVPESIIEYRRTVKEDWLANMIKQDYEKALNQYQNS